MNIKKATYSGQNGPFEVEYDADAPCQCCGLPVEEASMGGTNVCPACDCGVRRDGEKYSVKEMLLLGKKEKTPEDWKEIEIVRLPFQERISKIMGSAIVGKVSGPIHGAIGAQNLANQYVKRQQELREKHGDEGLDADEGDLGGADRG
jgi:hypothetical protein